MKHSSSVIVRLLLGASLLCAATPAYAYLTPGEVFEGIDYVPPNRRSAPDVHERQQRESAQAREEAHAELFGTDEEEVLHPAAPENPAAPPKSIFSDEAQFDRRMERLDGRPVGTTIIIMDGKQVMQDVRTGEILRSGAPRITATGTGEIIAAFALFAAATATFLWGSRQKAGAVGKMMG